MNERLERLKTRVRTGEHRSVRQTSPIAILPECEAENLSWPRRIARLIRRQRTCHACRDAVLAIIDRIAKKRTNEEWLRDLRLTGSEQEKAIADLRDLLLRAALYFFSRNLGDFGGLGREEVLQRAEDCPQDALMAVVEHIPEFRGDSQFSTWAYKFAINVAMTAARHERWKGMGEEDRFFLYFALQAMIRARLIMYGPTIPAEKQGNLPFVEFMSSMEQAIRAAETRFPGPADVLVFPYGGITYPDFRI